MHGVMIYLFSFSFASSPFSLKEIQLLFTPFDFLNQDGLSRLSIKFMVYNLTSVHLPSTWYLKHASNPCLVAKCTEASLQGHICGVCFYPLLSPINRALWITPFAYSWGWKLQVYIIFTLQGIKFPKPS